jgi:hypothetical protein
VLAVGGQADAGARHFADAVERVTGPAAVPAGVLLDASAASVQRIAGQGVAERWCLGPGPGLERLLGSSTPRTWTPWKRAGPVISTWWRMRTCRIVARQPGGTFQAEVIQPAGCRQVSRTEGSVVRWRLAGQARSWRVIW